MLDQVEEVLAGHCAALPWGFQGLGVGRALVIDSGTLEERGGVSEFGSLVYLAPTLI